MDDLDDRLARLASAPMPEALSGIEADVLARIATRPSRRTGLRVGVATTATALALGIVGAGLPPAGGDAPPFAPLGGGSPLTPSSLLATAP